MGGYTGIAVVGCVVEIFSFPMRRVTFRAQAASVIHRVSTGMEVIPSRIVPL